MEGRANDKKETQTTEYNTREEKLNARERRTKKIKE